MDCAKQRRFSDSYTAVRSNSVVKSRRRESKPMECREPGFQAKRTQKDLLASSSQVSTEFSHSLSFIPTLNNIAQFTKDQFVPGAPEWSLSLVGYSTDKILFYESLLATIKKTWTLICSLSLFTKDDEFFLLKFSTLEDYEYAWTGGPWFFFNKPFILQKWTPDFIPTREEFPSIPFWINIMNLPLFC
ncbi:hypothetical protein M5K25_000319 [Dendrobium thyrsiflorum]|uniref:DUF4283 domain-containing protein n=1 Tax=Dendrobium thyrsiflorum TaxID=117978 RepID=A0ABD0W6K2_DENTH